MNSKLLLLSVAVIAIGLFAMPSSLSLFSGQHTFDAGTSVRCNKCHQDIYNELLAGSGPHNSLTDCQGCHRTGNLSGVWVNKTTTGDFSLQLNRTGTHAAVTLECVACHTGVPSEITNSSEAHSMYYWNSSYNANASSLLNSANQSVIKLKGANTACVGCHTHIAISITWIRTTGYNMTVNESGIGNYNITYTLNTTTNTTYTNGK